MSDGSEPPERIPELAAAAGCWAVALTDHDRLDGIAPARASARRVGVELVPGCELSCTTPWGEAHLLAYFVDEDGGPLHIELERLQRSRERRNQQLARRLGELGLPVTLEEMEDEAGGEGVGRPHAAAVLVRKGVVGSISEAFDVWLGEGRPGHVERERPDVQTALDATRESGGVLVLAHPLSMGLDPAALDRAVGELAAAGLGGLEAIYGRYTPEERQALTALATSHGLVATGGSDYHGRYKPDLQVGVGLGDLVVPDDVLDRLESRRPSGKPRRYAPGYGV
ncbi:MAG: PHP domain-containing protein [Actinomycetota bacterium]|nr:PHP domain-containing protein [Actinomycetota bacterium]